MRGFGAVTQEELERVNRCHKCNFSYYGKGGFVRCGWDARSDDRNVWEIKTCYKDLGRERRLKREQSPYLLEKKAAAQARREKKLQYEIDLAKRIQADKEAGITIEELCEKYNFSEWKIKKELKRQT